MRYIVYFLILYRNEFLSALCKNSSFYPGQMGLFRIGFLSGLFKSGFYLDFLNFETNQIFMKVETRLKSGKTGPYFLPN